MPTDPNKGAIRAHSHERRQQGPKQAVPALPGHPPHGWVDPTDWVRSLGGQGQPSHSPPTQLLCVHMLRVCALPAPRPSHAPQPCAAQLPSALLFCLPGSLKGHVQDREPLGPWVGKDLGRAPAISQWDPGGWFWVHWAWVGPGICILSRCLEATLRSPVGGTAGSSGLALQTGALQQPHPHTEGGPSSQLPGRRAGGGRPGREGARQWGVFPELPGATPLQPQLPG